MQQNTQTGVTVCVCSLCCSSYTNKARDKRGKCRLLAHQLLQRGKGIRVPALATQALRQRAGGLRRLRVQGQGLAGVGFGLFDSTLVQQGNGEILLKDGVLGLGLGGPAKQRQGGCRISLR